MKAHNKTTDGMERKQRATTANSHQYMLPENYGGNADNAGN